MKTSRRGHCNDLKVIPATATVIGAGSPSKGLRNGSLPSAPSPTSPPSSRGTESRSSPRSRRYQRDGHPAAGGLEFEQGFAEFVGGTRRCRQRLRPHLSSVPSSSIRDEVITVSHTCMATVGAIVNAGGKPILVMSAMTAT